MRLWNRRYLLKLLHRDYMRPACIIFRERMHVSKPCPGRTLIALGLRPDKRHLFPDSTPDIRYLHSYSTGVRNACDRSPLPSPLAGDSRWSELQVVSATVRDAPPPPCELRHILPLLAGFKYFSKLQSDKLHLRSGSTRSAQCARPKSPSPGGGLGGG